MTEEDKSVCRTVGPGRVQMPGIDTPGETCGMDGARGVKGLPGIDAAPAHE